MSAMRIVRYSEKSIAVLGDSRKYKEVIKAQGGVWNTRLTFKGRRVVGWIFPATWRGRLEAALREADLVASSSSSSAAPAAAAEPAASPGGVAAAAAAAASAPPSPPKATFYAAPDGEFIVVGQTNAYKEWFKAQGAVWTGGWVLPSERWTDVEAVLAAPAAAAAAAAAAVMRGAKREREPAAGAAAAAASSAPAPASASEPASEPASASTFEPESLATRFTEY
jgi:hypothetical protein